MAGMAGQPDHYKTDRARVLAVLGESYVKAYERGWRYSGTENPTLEHLDRTNAPDASYDGYQDRAVGLDKWSSAMTTVWAAMQPPRRNARGETFEQWSDRKWNEAR